MDSKSLEAAFVHSERDVEKGLSDEESFASPPDSPTKKTSTTAIVIDTSK